MTGKSIVALALAAVTLTATPAAAAPVLTQSFELRSLAAIAERGAPVGSEEGGRRLVTSTDSASGPGGFYEATAFAAWTAADRRAESRIELTGRGGLGGVFDMEAVNGQALLSFDASVRNDGPNPVELSFLLRTFDETAAGDNRRMLIGSTNRIFFLSSFYRDSLLAFDFLPDVDGRNPGPFGECDFLRCAIPVGTDNLLPIGRLAPGETFATTFAIRSLVRMISPDDSLSSMTLTAFNAVLGFTGVEIVGPPPPPAPAPATLALFGLGVVAVARARRMAG